MRTILSYLIILTLALALAGCSFFDDSPEEPVEPAVAEETATDDQPAAEAATPPADGTVVSTNTVHDVPPDVPFATMQLANGSTLEMVNLIKLGNYYIYITGELNGRVSTVISFTRFQDLLQWESFIFKDENNFIIIDKKGKELVFVNARIFLGNNSNKTYKFRAYNENYEEVEVEVKKSDVASIKFK